MLGQAAHCETQFLASATHTCWACSIAFLLAVKNCIPLASYIYGGDPLLAFSKGKLSGSCNPQAVAKYACIIWAGTCM